MQVYLKDKFRQLKRHPNRGLRISIGMLLILGGILGFLPIVGFWMLPLGLILLAADFQWAKRLYARGILWHRHWRHWRQHRTATKPQETGGGSKSNQR